MKLFLFTSLAALGMAQIALASTDMDADGDGMVTWEEVQTSHPGMTEDQFAALDVNGDGSLDSDEVKAAQDAGQLPAEG